MLAIEGEPVVEESRFKCDLLVPWTKEVLIFGIVAVVV
jgi:hypothetical protein